MRLLLLALIFPKDPAVLKTAVVFFFFWAKFGLLRCYYLGQVVFYKTLFPRRAKPCFFKPRFSREFLHPLRCSTRTHSGSKTAWIPRALSLPSGKYPLGCSSMCWLSWFSGPGCCSCPGFHLGLGASDCSPGLAFCFTGPWTLLGSAACSSPTIRAKTGRTAHVFTAQGGTRRCQGQGCKGACAEDAQSCWSRKTRFEKQGLAPLGVCQKTQYKKRFHFSLKNAKF